MARAMIRASARDRNRNRNRASTVIRIKSMIRDRFRDGVWRVRGEAVLEGAMLKGAVLAGRC